jgi:MFS family permease
MCSRLLNTNLVFSFIGRTVPNLLADKYGRFNVMTLMILFSMITILGIWLPGRSEATSIVFAALFGISSGATIGLGPVLIMSISPMNEIGYRMGTIFAICGVASLTSPPIGGAIVEATKGGVYDFACVFSGLNYGIALVLILWLRVRLVGWKIGIKG